RNHTTDLDREKVESEFLVCFECRLISSDHSSIQPFGLVALFPVVLVRKRFHEPDCLHQLASVINISVVEKNT
ncbi:hypothetical protein PMAYCL1PPCAC_03043, partial [Pristionchus mayeri]